MRKKFIGLALCAMLLALCSSADAQQPAKVPRSAGSAARTPSGPGGGPGTGAELFRREFSKLGYVEGKNITIEFRYADNQLDRLPGLADELVRLKVDVLVTPGDNGSPSCQERY